MVTRPTSPTRGDERSPRQRQLVGVAARLFTERGYHAVSVADISGQLGLSGPAFYRHFLSKEEVLVAVLNDSIMRHLEEVRRIVATHDEPAETLRAIVTNHVEFVFDQSGAISTWRTDVGSLPASDRSRLRFLQRLYTDEWVRSLCRLRPGLEADVARTMCGAAISLLQAPTEFSSALPQEAAKALLRDMALRALTVPAASLSLPAPGPLPQP